MTSFLNGVGQTVGQAVSGAGNAVSPLTQALNTNTYQAQQFQSGFNAPPIPAASGMGLPSSQVPALQVASNVRNIVNWFVPEIGIINMYVNPQTIDYNLRKLITPQRTKGGYIVQYWGEELTTLNIRGHTGSSGVEGLNVLYEIYRAEQYLFDPIALTMASNNSISGLNSLVSGVLSQLGGASSVLSAATQGVFGINPLGQNIQPSNIPSLASIALGIEMYYTGWVFRGFFTSFSFTESAERLGLFDYNIGFTVTQRRGYRTNSLPWQHAAIYGPSNSSPGGPPLSFSGVANNFPANVSRSNG